MGKNKKDRHAVVPYRGGQLQQYDPRSSSIAPQRGGGVISNIVESIALSGQIRVSEKRFQLMQLEMQAYRAGLELSWDLQMAPYKFDSETRVLAATASKAEEEAMQAHLKTREMEYNVELTKMELKRARKASEE